jgi:tRNA-dihydrouridine synthase
MQGLTNRGLRAVIGEITRPDVLFTEFVRVRPGSATPVSNADFVEATTAFPGIPLVVQVIGSADEGVVDATRSLIDRGVQHINVNMGCPWGRMTSVLAGGGMFRAPETVEPMLRELRALVPGSLSVKTRTGIDDERQIFDVLPAFEAAGIDFLVVHARTVKQKYKGAANHDLTREIVDRSSLPVIANGDVATPQDAARVLQHTSAHGLMLGRGAAADPLLFDRIRGREPARPSGAERTQQLARYFSQLLAAYEQIFQGDTQILVKLKSVLVHVDEADQAKWIKGLRKQKKVADVRALLNKAVQD